MSFRRTINVASALLGVLSMVLTASARVPWHAPDWPYRAVVKVTSNRAKVDVAAVRIRHAGTALEDGRDYRIFDGAGRPVPYQITFHDARRDTLISLRCGRVEENFYVYFGRSDPNVDPMRAIAEQRPGAGAPKPGPAAGGWVPKAGLVLTTMRRPRDAANPNSIDELTKLIEQSAGLDGADYHNNIGDGVNRFGDSDYFISMYRGWIRLPRTGDYGFCTASNESSFSFLDGAELVHWPGRHTEQRGKFGQKNAEHNLTAGLHYIEYYHEEVLLYQVAFLGYKPPGAAHYIGIPDGLFPQPHRAAVQRYERQVLGRTVMPRIELLDSLWPDKRPSGQYTRYRFSADAGEEPIDWNRWSVQWDFGDGQRARGTATDHVFLLAGRSYEVKLTAADPAGRKVERIRPLEVFPIEHLTGRFKAGQYKDYQPLVSGYDRAKLSAAMLVELANFFEETGERKAAMETALMALERADTSEADRLDAHLLLAADTGKPEVAWCYIPEPDATKHLRAALDLSREPAAKMQVMARLIRHLGTDRLDVQTAEKEYLRAKTLAPQNISSGRFKHAFRDATIAIGDAHLCAGKIEQAVEDYQTAEALAEVIIPQPVRAAKIGSFPERIGQLIQDGRADEAMVVVREWYEQLPADMPRGEILFWLGKLETLRGNHRTAIRPLRVALDCGQGAPFEAEAYWLLAEAYRRIADVQNQRTALATLVRSGLSGTWREKAIEALKKLEQE